MATAVKFSRIGLAANFTSSNNIYAQGELILEQDTNRVKWGDGVTAWNSLPYRAESSVVEAPVGTFTHTSHDGTQVSWTAGGGGSSDHGALTGLGDDDHTQYLTETRHDALASDNPHGVTKDQVDLGAVPNTDFTAPVAANTAKVTNANHTGEVTGSGALVITANAVTNTKLAKMAANTIKGNNTGSLIDPKDLNPAEVTAMLNAFTSSLKGLVPASGGGTSNYLRADGTFANPTPAFGGNLQRAASEAETSTTSGTFVVKTTLATPSLSSGTYRLGWYFEEQVNSGNQAFLFRIVVNGTVVAGGEEEPGDSDSWFPIAGHYYYVGAGVVTATIEFKPKFSATTRIRRSRLEFWRVS